MDQQQKINALTAALDDGTVESLEVAGVVYDLRPALKEVDRLVAASHAQPWHEGDYCVPCGARRANGGCRYAASQEQARDLLGI